MRVYEFLLNDEYFGRFVADRIVYDVNDDGTPYRVTFYIDDYDYPVFILWYSIFGDCAKYLKIKEI